MTVVFALSAVVLLCGFTFQDAPASGLKSADPGFGDINFTTYAGIAAAVTMAVGFVKKLWKDWVKGKEIYLSYGLSVGIGVVAKLLGAFGGPKGSSEEWTSHVIALLMTAMGAGLIHDKLVNPLKEKPSPK
jgi:hypothetical protein